MYGFSDQLKGIPRTRLSADRQGSSRYSTRIAVSQSTEHVFATPVELEPGVLRLTLPLPTGPRHVHCYLLRGDDGWTLVDTGPGLMRGPWDEILAHPREPAGPARRLSRLIADDRGARATHLVRGPRRDDRRPTLARVRDRGAP